MEECEEFVHGHGSVGSVGTVEAPIAEYEGDIGFVNVSNIHLLGQTQESTMFRKLVSVPSHVNSRMRCERLVQRKRYT